MAQKNSDIQVCSVSLHLLPIEARMPIKFGHQILSHVTYARVKVTVQDRAGRTAEGWGETPLMVEWGWPSTISYDGRHRAMCRLCELLSNAWANFQECGHPLELGQDFLDHVLPNLIDQVDKETALPEPMPRLATLICASAFDMAVHDAYGTLHQCPTYATYNSDYMNRDLGDFLEPAENVPVSFSGRFPDEFLVSQRPNCLPAWHLVGGLDPIVPDEIQPPVPDDGHPVALTDWIQRDGLTCLKVKLRGNDEAWDYERLVRVGLVGRSLGAKWLSSDFNCTVTDPDYVNAILDRLLREQAEIFQMLLYVEQPFPYDLEANRIDVHSVSARKPLFMDESAHDWKIVRLGRSLGWSGVALKTCKTQTGALLSMCWASAHSMPLMVQDLSNSMLAQLGHVALAAHVNTIMGVETNGSQFFPGASAPEAAIHPGLYRRAGGKVDLSTMGKNGIGFRIDEIHRKLPKPTVYGKVPSQQV